MNRKLMFILVFSLFINSIFGQAIVAEEIKQPPSTVNTVQTVVEQMNSVDLNHLLAYLIFIVLLILMVLFIIHKAFSFIIDKIEDLKIGSFSLKLKKNKPQTSSIPSMDFNTVLNVFELVMKAELKVIINDTVSSVNDIHTIEKEYDDSANSVFNKTFSVIERDLHDKLVGLACKVTRFNLINVKNTREYFFISDLLYEYKKIWSDDVAEITKRNGFVEFLTDRSKAEPYINELANAINQCIDMGKLESTDIPKKEIDEIIKSSYKDYHTTLENMFYNLATMKSKMFSKRNAKLQHIDDNIEETGNKIINQISETITHKISGTEENKEEKK